MFRYERFCPIRGHAGDDQDCTEGDDDGWDHEARVRVTLVVVRRRGFGSCPDEDLVALVVEPCLDLVQVPRGVDGASSHVSSSSVALG
jgi:hypothetical protein